MKKFTGLWITIIIIFCIGISLIVAGAASGATQIIENSGGLIDKAFDFIENNISEYDQPSETVNVNENTENVKEIYVKLEGCAVALKSTNKKGVSLKCKNIPTDDIDITSENGIMTIEGINADTNRSNRFVEILIPVALCPEVIIESVNSAISVEELSLDSLTCKTDNAAISVEELRCSNTVSLTTSNALISVDEINADAISIKSNTGIINFDSLSFNTLDITNVTGAINGELGSRFGYTVTTTQNTNTKTEGTGSKTVNITNTTGIINIEYDD